VIVSALVFAWKTSRHIYVEPGSYNTLDRRVYTLHGQLYFGSVSSFKELFDPITDPDEIEIDFVHSRVWDHSGLEAIVDLARRYDRLGKTLSLSHLSQNCRQMLRKANVILESETDDDGYHLDDFSYRVITSGLGGSNGH